MSFNEKSDEMKRACASASPAGLTVDELEAGERCSMCGKSVCLEDFRDVLSLKEYRISRMCQACQDDIFGY